MEIVFSKKCKSRAICSTPVNFIVEIIKARLSILKTIFWFNYVTAFCNSLSIFHFWVENIENKYVFSMEPSQSINLIILGLIVVMHAGVLALRLGISLART